MIKPKENRVSTTVMTSKRGRKTQLMTCVQHLPFLANKFLHLGNDARQGYAVIVCIGTWNFITGTQKRSIEPSNIRQP